MIKEAIDRIAELVRQEVQVLAIDGRQYSTKELKPIKDPQPPTLEVNSLTALVDYILGKPDKLPEGCMVHVDDYATVRLLGPLVSKFPQRDNYVTARPMLPSLTLGKYMDGPDFQIMLRSAFLPKGDRDIIIKLAGNVVDTTAITNVDDGMSQTVTAMASVATKANVTLPNPATLVPFRTFLEVEQPESEFIFRMEKGPTFMLREADGGAWKLKAMQAVKAWLAEKLGSDSGVIILA